MTIQEFIDSKFRLTVNLQKAATSYRGVPPNKLDPNTEPTNYKPGYHILAGVAKLLAAEINEDPKFDLLVREILNSSSTIQVTSKIRVVNTTDCQFTSFRVVFPPNFKGRIAADAMKNFFATDIKGKLSFKLKLKG
jgi:hypothetical protein